MEKKVRTTRRNTIHRVKTSSTHFHLVKDGRKKFDVRLDDKDYQVGDKLVLDEYKNGHSGRPEVTGESMEFKIIYILRKFKGLESGHIIMGLDN